MDSSVQPDNHETYGQDGITPKDTLPFFVSFLSLHAFQSISKHFGVLVFNVEDRQRNG
jgi:hypothetical protein